MTDVTDVIEQIVSDFEKTRKEFQTKAQATMKQAFTEFFKSNPTITSIEWTQYTPHFADGDECIFGVHEMYAAIGETPEDEVDEYVEDRSNIISTYSYDKSSPEQMNFRAFAKIVRRIPDEVYQATFGDHAKIVATREGFSIDEYEHD